MMAWMGLVNKIKNRNQLMFQETTKFSNTFDKEGFNGCILKGQGNALNYPDPYYRTSGDIDIWLWPKKKAGESNRKVIVDYVHQYFPQAKMTYLHIDFPTRANVAVEVHFFPSYLNNPIKNRYLQKYFNNFKEKISRHLVYVKGINATITFPAPTDSFNRIYQLCHIMHHYFDEGIGLRQLIDYYYLLRKGFSEEERMEDVKILKRLGMYRFAQSVMYVLNETLGLKSSYLLVPPNKESGTLLLRDILQGGNFGKYNAAFQHNGRTINIKRFLYKTLHNLSLVRSYPSDALWEPWFRTWHFLWRLRYR